MMATKKSIVVSAIEIVLWPVEPITPPITDEHEKNTPHHFNVLDHRWTLFCFIAFRT